MATDRDTQFQGFARLLLADLNKALDEQFGLRLYFKPDVRQVAEGLITRRAYDLVVHALNTCPLEAFEIMGNGVDYVPDLTEWREHEPNP